MSDCILFSALFATFAVLKNSTGGTQSLNGLFSMPFVLAEHVQVTSAEMTDGILTVKLQRHIPDSELPKKIQINSKPVLLQE